MKKLRYSMPVMVLLLFCILAFSAFRGTSMSVDNAGYHFFGKMQSSVGEYIFGNITHIFDTSVFLALSIILFILLWGAKRRRDLFLAISVLAGGAIIGELLKMAIGRERPLGYLIRETDSSFPSGHALKATLFLLLIIYLYKDQIKDIRWRRFFIIVCWVVLVLVALSRLYLGVHWLTDVVGGFLLGLGWVSLMIILFNKEK